MKPDGRKNRTRSVSPLSGPVHLCQQVTSRPAVVRHSQEVLQLSLLQKLLNPFVLSPFVERQHPWNEDVLLVSGGVAVRSHYPVLDLVHRVLLV